MGKTSLVGDLEGAFRQLDNLVERHRQALAYDAARERAAYLLERLRELLEALDSLRVVCLSGRGFSAVDAQQLWHRTCIELRDAMPTAVASPGRTLVAGDLELLRIVSYLGAAHALVLERCALASAHPDCQAPYRGVTKAHGSDL